MTEISDRSMAQLRGTCRLREANFLRNPPWERLLVSYSFLRHTCSPVMIMFAHLPFLYVPLVPHVSSGCLLALPRISYRVHKQLISFISASLEDRPGI